MDSRQVWLNASNKCTDKLVFEKLHNKHYHFIVRQWEEYHKQSNRCGKHEQ